MFSDDSLDIPAFLRGRPQVLAARVARSSTPWVEPGRRRITMTDPRAVLRARSERLNRLADTVQPAINAGAVTMDALLAALPDLSHADIRDGIQRLRDRRRWADLRRRTVNR